MRVNHHQFLHLRRLPLAEKTRRPISAGAVAEHDNAARALLFGVGNRCVDASENALGVGLGLFFAGFGDHLFGDLRFTASGLFDRLCGGGILACGFRGFRRRGRFDHARSNGVALQIRQGDTQAAPLDVRQFASQRADCLRPVSGFAGTGNDDHRAFGLGAVGRFPQGEESVAASLQLLLLLRWQFTLQCGGLFLTTLKQWLALGRFFFGGFIRGGRRRVGGFDGKRTRQDQRQAQCWQCQAVDRGHRLFQARKVSRQPNGLVRICQCMRLQ